MASGQPGAETVVSRLADILFVQAVRAHLARAARPRDRLAARAGRSADRPGARADSRASRSGVDGASRSPSASACRDRRFAARFTELVEEPPLTYLTRWRMTKASRLLRNGTSEHRRDFRPGRLRSRGRVQQGVQTLARQPPGAYPARRQVLAAPGRGVVRRTSHEPPAARSARRGAPARSRPARAGRAARKRRSIPRR